MRRLDNYTLRTHNLNPATLKARNVLVTSVEPDEMLFGSLPKTLGFRTIPADARIYGKARDYAESVGAVIDELTGCHDRLLAELFHLLLETSAENSRKALTGQAAALENEVINPTVRTFVLALAKDGMDSDTDWIRTVAMALADKAPAEWADGDLLRFRRELPLQVAAFQRLVALHAAHRASGGPFDALRVTITRSDGSEHNRLVGIDQSQRRSADEALDKIIEDMTEIIGSPHRARKALLALLGERLLQEQADSNDRTQNDSIRKGVQYG